jgi:EmrB/QacA subfamily drug resistance transporter
MSLTQASTSRAKWLAFTILCSAHLMIVLDISIVSVALPSIQRELGFSQSGLAWVTNAYLIAYGGLLLLSGRMGDLIGRKRIFVAGLVVFTVASLMCGLSTTDEMLVISRFVQGIGAAMAVAVVMAMIFGIFQEQRELNRAIGVLSFASAAGASIGIVVGGVLTDVVDWRWVFFINVPIGAAAVLLAFPLVSNDRGMGIGQGVDLIGGLLATAGLMLAVYTIVQVGTHGWTSAHTLGFGGLALVLLAAFVARQATAKVPLMPLRLFRSRNLSGANMVQFLSQAGALGFNFMGALYLQQVVGYSPTEAAFAFLPIAVLMGVVSIGLSTQFIATFGQRAVLSAGLLLLAAGLALMARAPVDASYAVDILPTALLMGAGFGLTIPPLVTFAMSVSQQSDGGLASGLFNTSGMAGGAIGLAMLAALAEARTNSVVAGGETNALEAQNSGLHLSFVISAALVFAAFVVGLLILRKPPAWTPPPDTEAPAAEPSKADGVPA